MSIIPEPEYFFDNPALQPDVDILGGEDHDVYAEARFVQGAHGEGRGRWVASFFPDLMAWDKVHSNSYSVIPNLSSCGPCLRRGRR